MRSEFGTREIDSRPYLGIRAKAKVEELGTILGPLFGEVYGYIQHAGPAACRHAHGRSITRWTAARSTSSAECPFPRPWRGSARIEACDLPSGKVATVTHIGPYDELGQTWSALSAWMESEGS